MLAPDWRQLPSLSALRAFEATARLGGFSAAARALNVTHAAVAQQVRGLEGELGLALVRREGRGLALTDAGARLAASLGEGFATIAGGVRAVRRQERERGLRVSTTTSFVQAVLMPKLAEFWAQNPGIAVSVEGNNHFVDLAREGFDLAIRAGSGQWQGLEAEFLARNQFQLAAAPDLIAAQPDLTRHPWLLNTRLQDEFTWLRAAGYDPDRLNIVDMENGALAVTGAIHGYGLVFGTDAVLRDEIARGRLVVVDFPGLPKLTYWAVTPPGPRRPAVQCFIDWLKTLVRVETD